MPAGSTAATAFSELQQRNIRSTNIMTVSEAVETISGIARCKIRAPAGPLHHACRFAR